MFKTYQYIFSAFLCTLSFSSYALEDSCTKALDHNVKAWEIAENTKKLVPTAEVKLPNLSLDEVALLRESIPDCEVLDKVRKAEK